MTDIWGNAARPPVAGKAAFRPSPVFLLIVAVFVVSAWALWVGAVTPRLSAFFFVVSGWLLSLCLHEYAHALIAYASGDRSVAAKGYLTLNPLKYTHAVYSIALPLLFVLLGGIGLPGGAVYIDRHAISNRVRHSLISAAGPATNIFFAALCLVPIAVIGVGDTVHLAFWAALAFLGFLQVTASLFNLLPVPGMDGYGILEPWLPREWAQAAAKVAPFSMLILFALLWAPPINRVFFDVVFGLVDALGVPSMLVAAGDSLFRFWLS